MALLKTAGHLGLGKDEPTNHLIRSDQSSRGTQVQPDVFSVWGNVRRDISSLLPVALPTQLLRLSMSVSTYIVQFSLTPTCNSAVNQPGVLGFVFLLLFFWSEKPLLLIKMKHSSHFAVTATVFTSIFLSRVLKPEDSPGWWVYKSCVSWPWKLTLIVTGLPPLSWFPLQPACSL